MNHVGVRTSGVHRAARRAKHVGVLIYSSYAYGEMPEEVQQGEDEAWQELGQNIAEAIEAAHPTTYSFKCYAVED